MLHVFYIISNVTARIVPHIIDRLGLDPNEVIVITDRSQTGESIRKGLVTEDASFKPFRNRWKTLFSDWKALFHNRMRINKITLGRKFVAYLPGPSDQYCQQILWHPRCSKYYLFEEGLGSYCQPGASPVQTHIPTRLQKINIKLRIRSLGQLSPVDTDYPHWPSKYGGCFGSNKSSFPEHPSPVIHLNTPLFKASVSSITRLLILDDFSVFNSDLHSAYLDSIRKVVSSEHKPNDHWAYKLHPRCSEWVWLHQKVEAIFRECLPPGTSWESLPPDTCAEDIGSAPRVTTYGYMSSCLFYIHQCGGNVASFKHIAENIDSRFIEIWSRYFPPVLEDLVGNYRMLKENPST